MEQMGQFIMNHWPLWLAFIGVLLLIFINELIGMNKKAKELSPQAAVDLINNDNAIVIDIRDKEAFRSGHIIDSINAEVADFETAKMNKYKNKKIILVCARGQLAGPAAAKLKAQGFDSTILSGGIAAWQAADLPLIKKKG